MIARALAVAALTLAASAGQFVGSDRASAAAVPAQGGVSDPVRFVRAAYGFDASAPDKPSPPEMLDEDKPEYTPRLRQLFWLQQREHGKDEVGRLDMDIFTGTQDGDIKVVTVEARDVDFANPPRKVVTARFTNLGRPTVMHFYFEKLGERWFLDDIAARRRDARRNARLDPVDGAQIRLVVSPAGSAR